MNEPSNPTRRWWIDWLLPPGAPDGPEWSERRKLVYDMVLKGVGLILLATFGSVVADGYRATEADRVSRSTRLEALADRSEAMLVGIRLAIWNSFDHPCSEALASLRSRIDNELYGDFVLLVESSRRKAPLLFRDGDRFGASVARLNDAFRTLLERERSLRDRSCHEADALRASDRLRVVRLAHGEFSRRAKSFLDLVDHEYLALNAARRTSMLAALGQVLSGSF
jgi:hypothetical protein